MFIINHFLHISFTLFNSLSTVDLIQGRTLLTLPKTPGMLKPAQPWPRDTTPICVARTLPLTWSRGQVNVVWKICSILSNAFGHFKLGKLVLDFSYILQPFYLNIPPQRSTWITLTWVNAAKEPVVRVVFSNTKAYSDLFWSHFVAILLWFESSYSVFFSDFKFLWHDLFFALCFPLKW